MAVDELSVPSIGRVAWPAVVPLMARSPQDAIEAHGRLDRWVACPIRSSTCRTQNAPSERSRLHLRRLLCRRRRAPTGPAGVEPDLRGIGHCGHARDPLSLPVPGGIRNRELGGWDNRALTGDGNAVIPTRTPWAVAVAPPLPLTVNGRPYSGGRRSHGDGGYASSWPWPVTFRPASRGLVLVVWLFSRSPELSSRHRPTARRSSADWSVVRAGSAANARYCSRLRSRVVGGRVFVRTVIHRGTNR